MSRREQQFNWPEWWSQLRNDYRAARDSRFVRRRTGYVATGSGADYHYRSEYDYLKIMELARDFERNDTVVGCLLDRAADNVVQGGLIPDPAVEGDKGAELALKQRWAAWADDPSQCETSGRYTYTQVQWLAERACLRDGDLFAVPREDHTLELQEGHRCRTPSNTTRNVVHGVLMEEGTRRPREYWFTREDIDPNAGLKAVSEIVAVPAFAPSGNRLVFHVIDPRRSSQTRGVSAFATVFAKAAMLEDIDFAKLVQQQVVSSFAVFHEVAKSGLILGKKGQKGPQKTETMSDGMVKVIQGVSPGLEVWGNPGEVLKGFSPDVPNTNYFEQYTMLLQMIAAVLNVPLIAMLLDAKETNFTGWRGAINQAQTGWRRQQRMLRSQLVLPTWQWKLAEWMREDGALRRLADRISVRIPLPQWPYIQPEIDAIADDKRRTAMLASPREISLDRGRDWDDLVDEIVADNARIIQAACDKATELAGKLGAMVDPRQLIVLDPARPLFLSGSQLYSPPALPVANPPPVKV